LHVVINKECSKLGRKAFVGDEKMFLNEFSLLELEKKGDESKYLRIKSSIYNAD
jgi:hypothetical protein